MPALLNSRYAFWLLLALPALAILLSGDMAMDKLHPTGEWSARLLILALAITPLLRLTRRAAWVRWLQVRRRYIGVAAFAYAALHLVYYVIDMADLGAILDEALIVSILTGWLAFFAMTVMAVASNDAAMRALGASWKRVQRLAYPAALLTLAHWILIHDGLTGALVSFAPLALLELYRIFHDYRTRIHRNA